MKDMLTNWRMALCVLLLIGTMTSCDMMHEDMDDCPMGLYLKFEYDYNLQRADMFNDHVGAVTLYVFDENGKFVMKQEEHNTSLAAPLASPSYTMHVTGLQPGRYKMVALAGQKAYDEMLTTQRAKFVREEPKAGDDMETLEVKLDKTSDGQGGYDVVNNSLPLDTLWHGMQLEPLEVSDTRPTYGTISLVRDTKKINVTLREIDDPTTMDIDDYDMTIIDHNSHILWDNSLDETDRVTYKPHMTWNTEDREPAYGSNGEPLEGVGRIGHADFMTSRILYHEDAKDDAVLAITDRETGHDVVVVNLPDLLCRNRISEEFIYTPQEFLDRGYDYRLDFYLKGGKLNYVYITVSVNMLSWSKRVQIEELQ